MKTALVTGGTGTISSGMVDVLIQNGFETYALTRGNKPHREKKEAEYLHVDKEDISLLEKKVGDMKFDVIIECLVYKVEQLKRSLDFFAKRCGQYVFISTTGIYKRENQSRIKENNFIGLLEWEYSRDKIECEKYLREYGKKTGLNYTIVRPPVVYGDYRIPFPVASRQNPWMLMKRIREGRPIVSCNCEKIKYEILHISDFSKAVFGLIGSQLAYQEVFHIADENCEYDWEETLTEISKVFNMEVNVLHIPINIFKTTFSRSYDELLWNKIDDLMLDGSKIREATGFRAEMTLEKGIKKIMLSMEDEYEKYLKQIDDGWNRCCDHTILVSSALGEIKENERKIAGEYIYRLKKEIYFS